MKETYLEKFIEILPALNEVMQEDINVVVIDARKMTVMAYAPGKLDRKVKVGDPIEKTETHDFVIRNNKQVIQKFPQRKGCGVAFRNKKFHWVYW